MRMKSRLFIPILAFILVIVQCLDLTVVAAAPTGSESVSVTKELNPIEIFEGGESEVTINVQGTPDSTFVKPNDIILIIDRSGSMGPNYGPNNGEDKMRNAKEAAKGFIDLVDFSKHRVGVVDFASNVNYTDLSSNPNELKQYIDTIRASGGTATKSAIEKAQDLLRNHRDDAQPVIILMTDGQATEPAPDSHARQVALEQANSAKLEGVVFYTIALLLPTENPETSAPNLLMKEMATTAHHHHFVLGSVGLAEIYSAIVDEIGVASAYDVVVTDFISPQFEIVPGSYTDNIPQPTVTGNTISWSFLELKNELLTFKYKIRHKSGADVGSLPVGDQDIHVKYKDYLGVEHQYSLAQPIINVKHKAPIITEVEPDHGMIQGGEQVVISGLHFRPNLTVSFGNTNVPTVQYLNSEQIIVEAPPGVQGNVTIKVTNDDGQYATADYWYYATPVIDDLTPKAGPVEGGTKVVISGNYFMDGAEVLFGGVKAAVSKTGTTSLEVVTPAGPSADPVDVTVINPDGTTVTAEAAYTYIQGPEIERIDPSIGPRTGGQQVVLVGQRFVEGAKIYFNSTLVPSSFVSAEEITLTTPVWSKADRVDVKIVNPNGQENVLPEGYTYEDPNPLITSVTPASGPMAGGTVVTIKGSYFKSGLQLFWGEREITGYSFISSTDVRLRTPTWDSPDVVSLKIVNPDGKEVEMNDVFTYLAPPDPSVASISPVRGLVSGGTTVAINGADFRNDIKVYFNTQEVPIESMTATRITVKTPEWPIPEKVDVSIRTSNGFEVSLPEAFEYLPLPTPPAPLVSSVSPSSGSVEGGNIVSINGSNFVNGLELYFNNVKVENYTFMNSSLIRLRVPAWQTAETITVKVINPDNQSGELVDGYTYIPLPAPTLTGVTPNKGPIDGGTQLKITGNNFKSGATVSLGDQEVPSNVVSPTEIRLLTPEWHQPETVDVKVKNPDGQVAILNNAYTFETPPPPPPPEPPVINQLTPNSGPQAGGTNVKIIGSNFTPNPVVELDGIVVPSSFISSSELRFITPAWPTAESVDIKVSLTNELSTSLEDAFTFIAPPEKPAPEIKSLTPDSLEIPGGGVVVSVNGANFQNGAVVFFNDVELAATYMSSSQLRFRTPAWAEPASIDVKVVNPDGKEVILSGGFNYLLPPPPPPPSITSVSPNQGLASATSIITINGSDFINGAKVALNDVILNASYLNSRQLRVSVPVWGTVETVSVRVINPDGQESTLVDGYSFIADPPPNALSISPNTGLITGGGTVTLSGSNFKSGAVVYFNDQALPTTYYSSTQLRFRVPVWNQAGAVDVRVVNPDGQENILPAAYTYTLPAPKPAPTVTSISPNSGSRNGGYIVDVRGTNFQSGATITINGVTVSATYMNSSTLRLRMPASSITGVISITVNNPDGQSATLDDGFTYH